MSKTKRARYTLEFKIEAVRLVQDGKGVTAEQMEISRLRAELARVKMERAIIKWQRWFPL
jgi:transposase